MLINEFVCWLKSFSFMGWGKLGQYTVIKQKSSSSVLFSEIKDLKTKPTLWESRNPAGEKGIL